MRTLMYLLWHTTRQGWMQRSGGTTTEVKDAGMYEREDALKRCRDTKDHQGNVTILPVKSEDIL